MATNGPGYISKDEKLIPIEDPSGKWSELYLLPEWAEKYYDVYTVRKYGKWVMLKALKKEYADKPEYRAMLEKEFDIRYNLCHPNIVMVNDLEVVPGVGMAIITDDVYGYSLRRLIDEKRLTPQIVHRLQTQLLDAMEYIQENHIRHVPITPESILFTEYNENLKLTNVGYDQTDSLPEQDTRKDIESYGKVINEVLDNLPASLPKLRKIARKCMDKDHPYRTVSDLQLAMERRNSAQLYIFICCFIVLMAALLVWLVRG
ncbi:MAG: protein kinase [Muribaculaceae bacterium]|nr:protein kinase [Muribaculaceae bacterium]MDE5713167.1 protein kinase [Muribaculaceae bacterium]